MALNKIVEKEKIKPMPNKDYNMKEKKVEVYSPKLGKPVEVDLGNTKGEVQKYNIGLGPGSWY